MTVELTCSVSQLIQCIGRERKPRMIETRQSPPQTGHGDMRMRGEGLGKCVCWYKIDNEKDMLCEKQL